MSILNRPEPQVLWDRLTSLFSSTVLGGAPIIPESNEFYVVANDYAVAEEFYSASEQQWRERDPRYACCDNLIAIAADDGVYPIAASFAQGYGLITGVAGAALPTAITVDYNSVDFSVVSEIPSVMPATGELVVRLESDVSGPEQNTSTTGIEASLKVPITDVNDTVSVYGNGFCGGVAAETCEEFRTRYVDRKRYKPLARLEWIINKTLEWPCVTRVCVRAGACCDLSDDGCDCQTCGTLLQLYPMMDDTFECGLPPQCVVDEITEWMFGENQGLGEGQVEYGVCGRMYAAEAANVDISIEGAGCLSASQLVSVRAGLEDMFSDQCPSDSMGVRNIELVIAQIVGHADEFEVVISSTSTRVAVNECGDIEPECDVQLCLGEVSFVGETSNFLGDC